MLALPRSIEEAVALKGDHPGATLIAGGTDLMVSWPEHTEGHDRDFVDLGGVDALRGLRWSLEWLEIGAMSTYWDVLQDELTRHELPILLDAARQVGAIQIQSRGTWAGNIANASPAADGVPVLMACDATVVLRSRRGVREVPLDRFYHGYKQMEMRPDELIEAVRVPRRARPWQRFEKVGPRRAQAITKVGVAVVHGAEGWRVVANSMAPTVRRCRNVERLLEAGAELRGPGDLLEAIDLDVTPIDDIRSTARYRREVMARVLYQLVAEA